MQNNVVEFDVEPRLSEEKTFLAVPWHEKDFAKKLGARWDVEAVSWYAPKNADLNKLEKWLPTNQRPKARHANFTCKKWQACRTS